MLAAPVQVFIGNSNVEGTTNALAVPHMSASNKALFGYDNLRIGTAEAPLWRLPDSSDPNATTYDDWLQAWDQVQQA
jgi:hypothetical protein